MHAFDILGDPVRRRILELLADGELTSGAVAAVVQAEFGISQPAVSQHLKVLRDSGGPTVHAGCTRSTRPRSRRSTCGWRRSAASGISASIRSRPSLPAVGASAD